jgi:ABC-type transport system substrate-binding protein
MKLFYIIAVIIVAILALAPMYLLPEAESLQAEVVDYYTEDGEPVYLENPVIRYDTYGGAIRSVDSTTCSDTSSSAIQGEFYEGLYAYDYLMRDHGRPVVIPQLATELAHISEDRLRYTIPLRKGVRYHRNPCFGKESNGLNATREVVAGDFVLSFKRIADGHNVRASLAWGLISGRIVGLDDYRKTCRDEYRPGDFSRYNLDVEGVRALDDHTLQLTLTRPYPQLQKVLAMHVYAPCPREAVDYWLAGKGRPEGPVPMEKRQVNFTTQEQIVGTGPYLLQGWTPKHDIVLVRNPEYREQTYPSREELLALVEDKEAGNAWLDEIEAMGLLEDAGKSIPMIDAMHFRYVKESFPAWNLFLTKQSDASGVPREAFDAVFTPGEELTEEWQKRAIYVRRAFPPTVYWIVFNMDDPVLGASPSLRRALCMAYNVDAEMKLLRNGRGRRATSIVPSAFAAHEAAGPGPYYCFDLDEARKHLDKAREELAAAGQLTAEGRIPKLKFYLTEGGERLGQFVEQQFGQLGVDIEAYYQDWPTLQHLVHTHQAQMFIMGWHADYYDAENFLQLFYSENIAAGTNSSLYRNERFDEIYEQIRTMPEGPERLELYAEAIRILCEDCPVLMTTELETVALYHDWYQNVLPHPLGYGFGKFRRIDTELRRQLGGRD